MLTYFPQVYPDELLYSVLARYQRHTRFPPLTQINHDLLGRRLAIPSLDHPAGISFLAALHPDPDMTSERILDELTLFNYFTAFVSPKLTEHMRTRVLGGDVKDWYIRSGYPAFRVTRLRVLRFCQVCKTRMLKEQGELYWKRSHQLPSVLVCPEHRQFLLNSLLDLKSAGRHESIAADPGNCPDDANPVIAEHVHDELTLRRLHRLAILSVAALESDFKHRRLGDWTTYYRRLLEKAGFVIGNSHMDINKLSLGISAFYNKPFQWIPGLDTNPHMPWLAKLARKQRSHSHPLQHLLLQNYLASIHTQNEPFGHGPWECRNPLADHYGRNVIQQYQIHSNRDYKVAVFKCICTYVYTRWFLPSTGQAGQARFQSFGEMLEPALKAFIHEGHSLRSIARKLHLDPKTVVRLAAGLRIEVAWKTGLYIKRRVVIQNVSKHVSTSIKRVKTACLPRLDWPAIDQDLFHRSKLSVAELANAMPPIKVTLSEIERRVKQLGWISKRLHKLPRTKKYLARIVESNDSYRKRRIEWAINELISTGKPLGRSNVLRKACVRSDAIPLVDMMLQTWAEETRLHS